jgi:hypothetical protein
VNPLDSPGSGCVAGLALIVLAAAVAIVVWLWNGGT